MALNKFQELAISRIDAELAFNDQCDIFGFEYEKGDRNLIILQLITSQLTSSLQLVNRHQSSIVVFNDDKDFAEFDNKYLNEQHKNIINNKNIFCFVDIKKDNAEKELVETKNGFIKNAFYSIYYSMNEKQILKFDADYADRSKIIFTCYKHIPLLLKTLENIRKSKDKFDLLVYDQSDEKVSEYYKKELINYAKKVVNFTIKSNYENDETIILNNFDKYFEFCVALIPTNNTKKMYNSMLDTNMEYIIHNRILIVCSTDENILTIETGLKGLDYDVTLNVNSLSLRTTMTEYGQILKQFVDIDNILNKTKISFLVVSAKIMDVIVHQNLDMIDCIFFTDPKMINMKDMITKCISLSKLRLDKILIWIPVYSDKKDIDKIDQIKDVKLKKDEVLKLVYKDGNDLLASLASV